MAILARTKEQKAAGMSLDAARAINNPQKDYQYANKDGTLSTIKAGSSNDALGVVSGYPNADPHTGVIEPPILSSAKGRDVVNGKITPVVQTGTDAITEAERAKQEAKAAADAAALADKEVPDDLKAALTEEAKQRAELDKVFANNQRIYKQLAISNTAQARAEIGSLQGDWDSARAAQESANKLEQSVYTQAGFRTGQARYAPELNANMMADVQTEGIQRLTKLDNGYRSAIAKVQSALMANNLQAALAASKEAQQYHQDALAEIQDQKKTALDLSTKAQAAKAKISRQASIIGLIKQGVTDPKQLFDYLNFDDKGNQTGDIDTNEINDVLKQVMPQGAVGYKFSNSDVGQLMSAGLGVQDIQAIQDDLNDGGPDTVLAGLSGAQKAAVQKVISNVSATGGIGGSLTISEARGLGLPLSLVGRSQPQVLADLSNSSAPTWFRQYIEEQKGQNLEPSALAALWSEFRTAVNETFISGKTAGAGGSSDLESQIDAAFPGG